MANVIAGLGYFMSKFSERTRSALLVIDVQNDVVAEAWHREQIIANISLLVKKAREANTPVIWVQHSDPYMEIGSDEWKIVPELQSLPSEPHVQKKFRSSFEDTTLDQTLADLGVGHLYISGAQTDYCVRHTMHASLERGYDVTLVGDAHTTSDGEWDSRKLLASAVIDEMNCSFNNYKLPGRKSDVVEAEALVF